MVDVVNKATRSRMMAGIRARDTKPEVFLRTSLHRMGFRYRLGGAGLPGKPDLVFRKRRIALFVHGCFWHRHADRSCRLARMPKSRVDFWLNKLEANRLRDTKHEQLLRKLGWRVIIIWECETVNAARLKSAISRKLLGHEVD